MVLTTGPPWKERQPDAPKCSETPLDSLTAKPTDIGLSTWRPFEPYAVGGFIGGAGTVIFVNKLSARPWYSGKFKIYGVFNDTVNFFYHGQLFIRYPSDTTSGNRLWYYSQSI